MIERKEKQSFYLTLDNAMASFVGDRSDGTNDKECVCLYMLPNALISVLSIFFR